ncbi:hypothetical protein DOY81_000839 [Sarcophaga bullata]|nr:hypothetical protein DOY81_000839 [Sarcophaga bullata]
MPSLMTCPPLLYQLSVTPEIRQHLRPFNCNTISISIGSTNNNASKNNIKFKRIDQRKKVNNSLNICNIYELKQQKQQQHLQQQQNSQRDCLQKIVLKKSQEIKEKHKRRRWILSCNLITILKKQIKLTNPTFDIQQQQQPIQQVQHLSQQQQQLQQKQHYICKI